MNHMGTCFLETKRLELRRFKEEDIEMVFNNWASEDKVTEFLTWPTHKSMEVTKMVISNWIKSYENNNFYQWAIILKDTNINIGTISVVKYSEEYNSVTIGYCIGSKWWGKGFVAEAFKEIIKFLFEEVKVNRISSNYDVNNPNSGKVMEKCGLKYEGTLREAGKNNKGIVDISIYAILLKDYLLK